MSHGDDQARAGNFIHTVDRLCRRPARSEGVQDSPHVPRPPLLHGRREPDARQHTGRQGIPLVRLSGGGDWAGVLVPGPDAVAHVISPGIPRALPDIQPGDPVPLILARAVAGLRGGSPRLRFPRFRLAARVVERLATTAEQEALDGEERARQALRDADRYWGLGAEAALDEVAAHTPLRLGRLLALVPGFVHDLRLSGRLPGLGGRFRWLRRRLARDQRGAPGLPALLAELDLADEPRVGRLLLDAFMADLARQYRRSPLHVRGASRVFYPLLLLNEHGGALVELLRERRQDLGLFDPVVVVSYESGPVGQDDDEEPLWALIRWRRELVTAEDTAGWRRMLTTPLAITAPPAPAELSRFDVAHPHWVPPARTAPWWASWAAIALFWTALVGAAGAYAWQTAHWRHASCTTGFWAPWADSGRERLGTECVGVAGPGYVFDEGALGDLERKIHAENARAAELYARPGTRPYVTIVYLAALTSADGRLPAAARERLAGVAVAQRMQNDTDGGREPLIRLVLANGGGRMQYGRDIPALLTHIQDRRAPIVGVVGLDQSRQATVAAIRELGGAGLPMVAATLSADRLVHESPYYFQVTPRNSREAAVAAAFAGHLADGGKLKRRARVYAPDDPSDYYSVNLRDQVAARLADRGFDVEHRRFVPEGLAAGPVGDDPDSWHATPREAGKEACRSGGLVYFAGRGIPDFPKFVQGIADQCPGDPPTIMGGDDVSRFVADEKLRKMAANVGFYYQSFAVGPADCAVKHRFYQILHEEYGVACRPGQGTLDGHAALSYDAAEAMIEAIRRLGNHRHTVTVNSFTVWRELTLLQPPAGSDDAAFAGLTGPIGFSVNPVRRYPRDKPVLVLRAEGAGQPDLVGHCGALGGEQDDWCAGIDDRFR